MVHRCLMLGAGGMAGHWLQRFLPAFADRIEVAALVEVQPAVLEAAADRLQLPANRRFTSLHDAFQVVDQLDVDCCLIVIPPAYHKEAALLAAQHGLHILSEKPIADTWENTVEIFRAVTASGVKMQVMQNYRYTTRIMTLKQVVDSGRIGKPNYIIARFAADYRRPNAWGAPFRHQMRHALLIEGAIHHFDQIRNLSGGDCLTIAGTEWNPGAASFQGECCALYVMQMDNRVNASYEGNCVEAGWQNSWRQERYRIECADGAVTLDRDNVVRIEEHTPGEGLRISEVPPLKAALEEHQAVIAQFLDWLDGGPVPPTALQDNIKSAAMLFAAIEASATNRTINIQQMLADAIQ